MERVLDLPAVGRRFWLGLHYLKSFGLYRFWNWDDGLESLEGFLRFVVLSQITNAESLAALMEIVQESWVELRHLYSRSIDLGHQGTPLGFGEDPLVLLPDEYIFVGQGFLIHRHTVQESSPVGT